jgi:excinuclease ABC subunit C
MPVTRARRRTIDMDIDHLPSGPGVYLMRDSAANIIYIGKAKDLRKRVSQYFSKGAAARDAKIPNLTTLIRHIDYIASASEREALVTERELIYRYQPFFNVLWKDAKSYPYIKITREDFPRIFFTRKKIKDGALYYGPYPKVEPLKKLLHHLWRIGFINLRRCRWDFSAARPLAEKKITACLYYHTKQCPAPCAGKISPAAYRGLAARAADFFKGDFAKLLKEFRAGMASSSKVMKYEKAANYRDFISAIEHMAERVRISEFKTGLVERETLKTGAVTALMRDLGLPKPPAHIEAFDTSSSHGAHAVAASVCFVNGQNNPAHYRHYKMRFENPEGGSDDFAMIKEAVGRRLAYFIKSGEPPPDLLLIDGGKGQLAAAMGAMRELKLKVPVIALAKKQEEIYLPLPAPAKLPAGPPELCGGKQPGPPNDRRASGSASGGKAHPVKLERDHPGLLLLEAIRNEVHRFGIKYHRKLRDKEALRYDE